LSDPQSIKLESLFPPEWFDPQKFANVQCGLYSTSLLSGSTVTDPQTALCSLASLARPSAVAFLGDVTDFSAMSSSVHVTFSKGQRTLAARVDMSPIPAGDYVLIASPAAVKERGEFESRERIRTLRGAFVALYGHTAAEHQAAWFFLNPNGTTSWVSPIQEMYLPPDAFSFIPTDWLRKLDERVIYLADEVKSRTSLALSFLDRSASVTDPVARFSNTWIALEIAASGKPDKLIKAICADGRKSGLLAELDLARNDLFHRGVTPRMSSDAERALILACLSDIFLRVGITEEDLQRKLIEIEKSHAVDADRRALARPADN